MSDRPRRDENGREYYVLWKGGKEIRLMRKEDPNGVVYYAAPVTFDSDDKNDDLAVVVAR